MNLKPFSLTVVLAPVVLAAACGTSNPTAPAAVAGPGPAPAVLVDAKTGVTIGAGQPVSPAEGKAFKFIEQPVALVLGNGITTGTTALTYTFEVATDAAFASKVYTRDNVAEGAGGQTTLTLDRLAGAKLYWRARSNAGSVAGPTSAVRSFVIGQEVVLQAPTLLSPLNNVEVNEAPVLVLNNVQRTGPAGEIVYRFEVSETPSFATLVYTATVTEQRGTVTQHQIVGKPEDKIYYWRARASDAENAVTTAYSATGSFKASTGVDLRTAEIVIGPKNIADWEETAKITDAYFNPAAEQLCIFHTRLGLWPPALFANDGTLVEGNQWIFARINGKWIGGAADWYKPGQACKGVDAASIGRDAFYQTPASPAYSWQPVSGEIFAVMSTTPSRAWPSYKTYDERSNVVLIKWP